MKDLYIYLKENEQIDEALFKSAIGMIYIKKMDPQYLLTGLLNMYEYIINKSDIKLFYEDFPTKERPFWTNVYKLYENKLWSIFDAQKEDTSLKDDIQDLKDEIADYEDDPKYRIKVNQLKRQLAQKERSADSTGIDSCFDSENELIDVTPEFRRQLRDIIKDSSLGQDDLNANNVNKIMLINDPQFDKRYIFTINKIQGTFRKILNLADIKMLEAMFKKISEM